MRSGADRGGGCLAWARGGLVGFVLLCAALYSEQEKANAHRPPVALPSTTLRCHCHPRDGDGACGSSAPPPPQVREQELMYKARGPVEKQRDIEEILFSTLLQQPVPQC